MSEILNHAAFLAAVKFDENGLVPAIAQSACDRPDPDDGLDDARDPGSNPDYREVTYWSRSRQKVWRKGETSGHTQRLVDALVDCDGDVVLLKVDQLGPACHTGAPSCFFRQLA